MDLSKKMCVSIFGAVIMAASASAQTTNPLVAKLSDRPESGHKRYNERIPEMIEDIAELPADTTGTIVIVGDSITEGFFKKSVMPETIAGVKVLNQGISGDQIDRPTSGSGVTHRVDLIKAAKPAVVFVVIGVNDFWGGKEEPAEVLPQYEKMVSMIVEAVPDAELVLESVLPTSKKNAYLNPKIDALNDHIKKLANQHDAMYLDLHPLMEDAKGELKSEFTGDGVHLTDAAYQVWLKKLQEVVPQVLPSK